MKRIRVHAIDDHALFRKGILGILADREDMEVVGESASVDEFLEGASPGTVDVLLLDLSIGDRLTLDRVPELQSRFPGLRILVLTMHNKPVLLKRAVNAGVHGYVVKQSPPETLFQAVKRVAAGGNFLDPELSESLYQSLRDSERGENSDGGYNSLTPREQEIFRLLAEGLSPDQIARRLYISRKTAENHRFHIMQKLGLSSVAELVSCAEGLGVI